MVLIRIYDLSIPHIYLAHCEILARSVIDSKVNLSSVAIRPLLREGKGVSVMRGYTLLPPLINSYFLRL